MNIYILRKLKKKHTLICETFQTVYGVIYTEVNLGDRIELAHMLQNWVSTHVLRMNFLKKKIIQPKTLILPSLMILFKYLQIAPVF